MRERSAAVFAEGFVFLEAPRWRHNRLWVSDVYDYKVYTLEADGRRTLVCPVPNRPSGLGFLPDGTPIVVSASDRKLMKIADGALSVYANLASYAAGDVNDFVVDESGRIYVGNFGYDFLGGAPIATTSLHAVEHDGSVRVAASGVEFPNGIIIKDRGRTLVVAETWAGRLTAFDRSVDGALSRMRVYADLGPRQPDGLCVDAEGGVWVGCYNTGEFLRVLEGGAVSDRIATDGAAVSCCLGGDKGTTLFLTTCGATMDDINAGKRLAKVCVADVDIPAT